MPRIAYTDEENRTWSEVYAKLKTLHVTHTCKAYRRNLAQLEDQRVFTMEAIPQLADVNSYLQREKLFLSSL